MKNQPKIKHFSIDILLNRVRDGMFYFQKIKQARRWSEEERLQYIDSLAFLGLPCHFIIVQEIYEGSGWRLVDGARRMDAILSFSKGWDKMDKEWFDDADHGGFVVQLRKAQIPVMVIGSWEDKVMIDNLMDRYNTRG